MKQSACSHLLYRTFIECWERGAQYVRQQKIKIIRYDETCVEAVAHGTKNYDVRLSFCSGGISRSCNCPVRDFCKHIVATAIVWDEVRGIRRPTEKEVVDTAIPTPLVSYTEVQRAFNDPLHADLDVIRIASDELGWSRPHAHLPKHPKHLFSVSSVKDVRKCLTEMRSWSRKSNFDSYFCAGEIMASFCEVLRYLRKRWKQLPEPERKKILVECCVFEEELLSTMIDDSDGLHVFSEAHLSVLM